VFRTFNDGNVRLVGDVDGDHMTDLVDFGADGVTVARSSDQPTPAPPPAPTGVALEQPQPTSLRIKWQHAGTNVTGYTINYGPSGLGTTMTAAATQRFAFLTGLASSTTYCATVRAESFWGPSAGSAQVCLRTAGAPPPPPPSAPSITPWVLKSDQIGVRIERDGASSIESWIDANSEQHQNDSTDSVFRTFTGLSSHTQYCVHARAVVGGVTSQEAKECYFTEGPPPCSGGASPQTFTFCAKDPNVPNPTCFDRVTRILPACTHDQAKQVVQSQFIGWDVVDGACGGGC
jgi:hypothetical protein